MLTSIGKFSKSFFVKLLVGIIILPFVFWGMGDVFRGGNQNVVATIDSKKLGAQEFINYINQLNLDKDQTKNIKTNNLIEKILSEYVGRKVMSLEIDRLGITVSENSIRNIIKSDEMFKKENKFSRTEYEKFLIKSGITANSFESNIVLQESRRQMLTSLTGGLVIPKSLVEAAFKKENQKKRIKYIDLQKFYTKQKPTEEEKNKLYNENKELFSEEFKSFKYSEITPSSLTGSKEFDENFFKQLDALENKVLDGQNFNEAAQENNFKVISIGKVNSKKKSYDKKKEIVLPDELFKKIFSIKNIKSPQIIKSQDKYYLAEVKSTEKKIKSINDPDVENFIKTRLDFKNKIEKNTLISKEIRMGTFDKIKMEEFANENNLMIRDYEISSLKQNEIFNEGIIKRIFLTQDGEMNLITNSIMTKNFLVLSIKTDYEELQKNSEKYERYEAAARLDLINKIYRIYDNKLNEKYKVELNTRTIDRIKNSF